jgi:hypothetical protein
LKWNFLEKVFSVLPIKVWREEVEWDGCEKMERVGDRGKIVELCSTGHSPQWAVVPTEEEDCLFLGQRFSLHFSHERMCVLHIVVWLFACFSLVLP